MLSVTFWLVWQNPLVQTVSHYPKSIVIREEALTMPPNFTTLRATVQRSLAMSELENGKGLKKRVLPVRQSSQQWLLNCAVMKFGKDKLSRRRRSMLPCRIPTGEAVSDPFSLSFLGRLGVSFVAWFMSKAATENWRAETGHREVRETKFDRGRKWKS